MTKDQELEIVSKQLNDVFESLKAYFPEAKNFSDCFIGIESLQERESKIRDQFAPIDFERDGINQSDELEDESEADFYAQLERGYAQDRM